MDGGGVAGIHISADTPEPLVAVKSGKTISTSFTGFSMHGTGTQRYTWRARDDTFRASAQTLMLGFRLETFNFIYSMGGAIAGEYTGISRVESRSVAPVLRHG